MLHNISDREKITASDYEKFDEYAVFVSTRMDLKISYKVTDLKHATEIIKKSNLHVFQIGVDNNTGQG